MIEPLLVPQNAVTRLSVAFDHQPAMQAAAIAAVAKQMGVLFTITLGIILMGLESAR